MSRAGRTAIHWAAAEQGDRVDLVQPLLEACPSDVTVLDSAGETPLHCAARAGNIQICQLLMAVSTQPLNVQSKKGDTPLILAACHGHVELDSWLREAGADATKTTRNGRDAAGWAVWYQKKVSKEQAREAAKPQGDSV